MADIKEMRDVTDDAGNVIAKLPVFAKPGEAAASPETTEAPAEGGFINGVKDVAKGVIGGIADGAEETLETIQWAAEAGGNKITGGRDLYHTSGDDGWEWLTAEQVRGRNDVPEWQTRNLFGDGGSIDIPEVSPNKTLAGGMVRGVAQFATAYLTFGRQLKVASGAGKLAAGINAAAGGAVADFVAFDAHEDRFSDFLRDNAGLRDPITEFLSADGDDTVLEGKLKNSLEGLGLGVAADGVMRLARVFRGAKKIQAVKGDDAAAEFMNNEIARIADEEPEVLQMELFDEASDPNLKIDTVNPRGVVGDNPAQPKAPELGEEAGGVTRHNADGRVVREAPKKPVNTDGLQAALDKEIALTKAGSFKDPNAVPEGELFNFDYMDSDVEIKDVLNMAAEDMQKFGTKDLTTFAQITKEATSFLADSVDVTPEIIDASLANMAKAAESQSGMVVAGKMLVQSLGREIDVLAHKITTGAATDMDYNRMLRLQSRMIETGANLKSVITGAAQATSAGRIRTNDFLSGAELTASDIAKQLGDNITGAGGRDALDKLSQAIVMNKNAKGGARGLMKLADGAKGPMGVINEVFINSILSGPKTQMINILSNAMNATLLPAEKMFGGVVGLDAGMIKEGARQYAGLSMAIKDAMKVAGTTFKTGRNMLDPEAAILEANGNDFKAIRSTHSDPLVRGVINGLGTVIRLPSRGLLTADEFFKQINYRSSLYARSVGDAANLVTSGQITKAEMGKWVSDKMDASVSRDGSAKSQIDLDYAREATFTQELRKGSISRYIQQGTNKYPALKLILPFVRTPTNIIKAAAQRTPLLHSISKTMLADLHSGDPRRMAQAKGKLVTGSALWGSAIMLAMEGKTTGNGPNDPAARVRLMETGWRPYSLVVGDGNGGKKYIEYRRVDPFGMFFGIAADVADIGGQLDDMTLGEIAGAAAVGLANNLASKTYLSGIVDAVNAFNDPERYGEAWINGYASSFVPMSSAMREVRKQKDPVMRDVQSMLDAVKNTVPGYSDSLPARRSWVTGQPITYPKGWGQDMVSPLGEAFASANPISEGEWKKDPVLDELARLDFGFSAPTRKIMGVEMSPEQYSRYMELHGTVRSGRSTMYQSLEKLFEKQQYDVNRERAPDFSDAELDPRIRSVKRIITAYRSLAKEQLLKEFPDLREGVEGRVIEAQTNSKSLLQGIADLGQ